MARRASGLRREATSWRVSEGPPRSTGPSASGSCSSAFLIYAIIIGVNFDAKVHARQIEALGARPLGLPAVLVVVVVETLLLLPMTWVSWHGRRLTFQAVSDRRRGEPRSPPGRGSISPALAPVAARVSRRAPLLRRHVRSLDRLRVGARDRKQPGELETKRLRLRRWRLHDQRLAEGGDGGPG